LDHLLFALQQPVNDDLEDGRGPIPNLQASLGPRLLNEYCEILREPLFWNQLADSIRDKNASWILSLALELVLHGAASFNRRIMIPLDRHGPGPHNICNNYVIFWLSARRHQQIHAIS
jgi:hypothetical protein